MHTVAVNWLSAQSLIDSFSTIGVIAIVFAETGLLIGIFLPGDSLLVAAGIAAGGHLGHIHLSLPALLIGCPIAAILGSELGYVIGYRSGPYLFRRREARFFKPEYVERTAAHLERFGGGRAIFLARFVPIVRTVLNPLAGVARLPLRLFTFWNIVSGLIWTIGLILLGYGLGHAVHNIDRYLLPGVALIILVSVVPIVREVRRARR